MAFELESVCGFRSCLSGSTSRDKNCKAWLSASGGTCSSCFPFCIVLDMLRFKKFSKDEPTCNCHQPFDMAMSFQRIGWEEVNEWHGLKANLCLSSGVKTPSVKWCSAYDNRRFPVRLKSKNTFTLLSWYNPQSVDSLAQCLEKLPSQNSSPTNFIL